MTDIQPTQTLKITMNRYGRPIAKNGESEDDLKSEHEKVSDFNHTYYKYGMNSTLGPAAHISMLESFSGLFLWWQERSPATLTNFLVSLAEYAQVHISRTPLLGDGKIGKQRREGSIAHIQGFAGVAGLFSFIKDFVKGEDEDKDLSTAKKVGLSGMALINSSLMFLGFGEKSLLSVTSRGLEHNECEGMRMNAASDLRVSVSWLTMVLYPWITSVKFLKKAIDFVIPSLALRDALLHYANEGVTKVFSKSENIKLPEKLSKVLNSVLLSPSYGSSYSMPWIFRKQWFLGENGFRDKYIIPVSTLLGCKVPKCNIQKSNGATEEEFLISVDVDDYKKAIEIKNNVLMKTNNMQRERDNPLEVALAENRRVA